MQRTTVMVAQADGVSRRLASRTLRRWGPYEVVEAEHGDEALQLVTTEVEIAVVDCTLPGAGGLELCQRVKSDEGAERRYVIMAFTATENDQVLPALEAGADDYLIRPVDPDDLLERVTAGERALHPGRWAGNADRHGWAVSHRDSLTGLVSNVYFRRALREEVTRARRQRQPLALTVIDLDDLKRINETCGRAVGDELLRQIGKMIADEVRLGTDMPARCGGDVFAVSSPNTNMAGAKALAERLRKAVLEVRVLTEREYVAVTASAGIAIFGRRRWGDDNPAAALFEAVQHRLYQAKLRGGNCVAG